MWNLPQQCHKFCAFDPEIQIITKMTESTVSQIEEFSDKDLPAMGEVPRIEICVNKLNWYVIKYICHLQIDLNPPDIYKKRIIDWNNIVFIMRCR